VRPQRSIVILAPDAVEEECCKAVFRLGGRVVKRLPLIRALVVEGLDRERCSLLGRHHGVKGIEDDIPVRAIGPAVVARPWRPLSVEQCCGVVPWGVRRVGAPQVWRFTRGEGVTVAILDTGISIDHPDLAPRLRGVYNAVGGSDDDHNGHGTHVAGIVAGGGIPGGVYGVAPKASLLAVKVLGDDGSGRLSDIIDGLDWCVKQGAPVANLSLGTPVPHPLLKKAVDQAKAAGVLVVAAAGNSGPRPQTLEYPAAYESALAVGACDRSGGVASFSSRGEGLDVVAPGKDIYSTWLRGGYRRLDGTSMAAPHVAGVAALLLAAARFCGGRADVWLRQALLQGAEPLRGLLPEDQGKGVISAPRALTRALATICSRSRDTDRRSRRSGGELSRGNCFG